MSEPENIVLTLLREIRAEMATKNEVADLRSDVKSLRADVASDIMSTEKRLSDRIAFLNRAVVEYHSSAIGHGVLISEFEDRLRRVEEHLNLPPRKQH
jgi:hypothetical protein